MVCVTLFDLKICVDARHRLDVNFYKFVFFFFSFGFFFSSQIQNVSETSNEHLNVELQHSMRLFRAQRNFYISGFSIFLTLVIRRLVILISSQAQLLAQSEASMRQAQSATTAARTLLSQQKDDKSSDGKKDDSKPDELVSHIAWPFEYIMIGLLMFVVTLPNITFLLSKMFCPEVLLAINCESR